MSRIVLASVAYNDSYHHHDDDFDNGVSLVDDLGVAVDSAAASVLADKAGPRNDSPALPSDTLRKEAWAVASLVER